MKKDITNEKFTREIRIGDTVEKIGQRRDFKLIRRGLALGLCGVLVLNGTALYLNDAIAVYSGINGDSAPVAGIMADAQEEVLTKVDTTIQKRDLERAEKKTRELLEEMMEEERKKQEELERQKKMDEMVEKYCSYFCLDTEKAVKIARKLTYDYAVDLKDFVGYTSYAIETEEMATMIFAYRLYGNNLNVSWEDLGVESDDLFVPGTYQPRESGEPLIVGNGDTGSQFLGEICDVLGLQKDYILAITLLETGRFNSPLCRLKNNLGGLRMPGVGYLKFPTPEAGIIAHCLNLKGYEKFGFQSLEAMSMTYAPIYVGKEKVVNTVWVNNIRSIRLEVVNRYDEYFHPKAEEVTEAEDYAMTMKPVHN